jgi:hypothetical protein
LLTGQFAAAPGSSVERENNDVVGAKRLLDELQPFGKFFYNP